MTANHTNCSSYLGCFGLTAFSKNYSILQPKCLACYEYMSQLKIEREKNQLLLQRLNFITALSASSSTTHSSNDNSVVSQFQQTQTQILNKLDIIIKEQQNIEKYVNNSYIDQLESIRGNDNQSQIHNSSSVAEANSLHEDIVHVSKMNNDDVDHEHDDVVICN